MDTDTKTEGDVVDTQNNEGEGEVGTISISKTEFEKLNQTLGAYKKELKDLKKAKEEIKETTKETPQSNQKPDDNILLQKLEKMALRQANITHQDDVELAQKTAKKWGMDIDEVLADEDFKAKLEKQQTARANVEATSNIKGSGSGASGAKNTVEYWLAKGTPPTPADVSDRKLRAKVVNEFIKKSKGMGANPYYNG